MFNIFTNKHSLYWFWKSRHYKNY